MSCSNREGMQRAYNEVNKISDDDFFDRKGIPENILEAQAEHAHAERLKDLREHFQKQRTTVTYPDDWYRVPQIITSMREQLKSVGITYLSNTIIEDMLFEVYESMKHIEID